MAGGHTLCGSACAGMTRASGRQHTDRSLPPASSTVGTLLKWRLRLDNIDPGSIPFRSGPISRSVKHLYSPPVVTPEVRAELYGFPIWARSHVESIATTYVFLQRTRQEPQRGFIACAHGIELENTVREHSVSVSTILEQACRKQCPQQRVVLSVCRSPNGDGNGDVQWRPEEHGYKCCRSHPHALNLHDSVVIHDNSRHF